MFFGILGPVEARTADGTAVALGGRQLRALLAVDPDRVDLHRFTRLGRTGRQARTAGEPVRARRRWPLMLWTIAGLTTWIGWTLPLLAAQWWLDRAPDRSGRR